MSNFDKTVAVIGAGSIGERYIRNLNAIGFKNIVVFRQRNLPFRDIGKASVKIITEWAQLLEEKVFAAFICTPTIFHTEQAIKLINQGVHVLIEKPLSHTVNGVDILEKSVLKIGVYVQIGYMMRFHPHVKLAKQIVESKRFGNLISIQTKWSEYLPDWHPWEDYKISYAARKDLGGGVALTLSHDIDLANWISGGKPVWWSVSKNYSSSLNLDVDSCSDILITYENKVSANIHLNFFERNKERFLKLAFNEASIHINFLNDEIKIYTPQEVVQKQVDSKFDRNQLFIDELLFFFKKIENYSLAESIEQIEDSRYIIKICNNE